MGKTATTRRGFLVRASTYTTSFMAGLPRFAQAEDLTRSNGAQLLIYDPDLDYQNLVRVKAPMEAYFAMQGLSMQIQPVASSETFESLLSDAEFAIVSSRLVKRYRNLRPLLQPTRGGTTSYRRSLVSTESRKGSVRTVAATVTGTRVEEFGRNITPLVGRAVQVIRVPKDIDALLALAFGQVDAAVAAESSLDVLRKLNPAAASSIRVLADLPRSSLPPLCENTERSSAARARLSKALIGIMDDPDGRKAMIRLRFDGWVPPKAGEQ